MKVLGLVVKRGEKVGIVFFSDATRGGEMLEHLWVEFFFGESLRGQDLDDEMLAKKVIQHVLRQRL